MWSATVGPSGRPELTDGDGPAHEIPLIGARAGVELLGVQRHEKEELPLERFYELCLGAAYGQLLDEVPYTTLVRAAVASHAEWIATMQQSHLRPEQSVRVWLAAWESYADPELFAALMAASATDSNTATSTGTASATTTPPPASTTPTSTRLKSRGGSPARPKSGTGSRGPRSSMSGP